MPVPVFEVAVESVTLIALMPWVPLDLAVQPETFEAEVMPVPSLEVAVAPVTVSAEIPWPSLSLAVQLLTVPSSAPNRGKLGLRIGERRHPGAGDRTAS